MRFCISKLFSQATAITIRFACLTIWLPPFGVFAKLSVLCLTTANKHYNNNKYSLRFIIMTYIVKRRKYI
uniref:Uncharacterized protein n=1 Tax=Oryza nivara TaxID=4536 RepID=A0A0E0HYC0_ORYNI